MVLKRELMRRAAVLALAATLLTGSASALFGGKKEDPPEGAPQAEELEVRTYRDIPGQGSLRASDPEGDAVTFQLDREPKKGVVVLEEGGVFTYTPDQGVTGGDSFTYTATDSQGNVSLPAKVTVRIEKTRSGVAYADTEDSPSAWAAQYLAEKGVFTGGKIGGRYYFQPDLTVSREEFLAMALETAGREVTEVTMTGFCDDASIPAWAKDYAAAGVAGGVVKGRATPEGVAFQGGEAITFNEAASILDRVLDLGDVDLTVWYAGREAVPSWADQAVGNMEAVNVLEAGSFGSSTMTLPVTRAEAAKMLAAAGVLLEGAAR